MNEQHTKLHIAILELKKMRIMKNVVFPPDDNQALQGLLQIRKSAPSGWVN